MRRIAATFTIVATLVLGACTKAAEPVKIPSAKVPQATNAAGTSSTAQPPATSTDKSYPDFGTRAANAINQAKKEETEENKRVDEINKQIDQQ